MNIHINKMNIPLISVNMVTYNSEDYIKEAIQSILDQTLNDFELIIVNDGSIDNTKDIINSFSDPRIKYYENFTNMGQNYSRAIALSHSVGDYIAVMDADDISLDIRLEKQIEFMENNKDHGLVGSLAEVIDKKGRVIDKIQSKYYNSDETKVYLFFRNCFSHSSILFRKDMLEKVGIDQDRLLAADYEIIIKISRLMKVGNINEVLVKYRQHNRSELSLRSDKINISVKGILLNQINELGLQPSEEELNIHHGLNKKTIHHINKQYYIKLNWLDKLFIANQRMKVFPEPAFYNRISGYWFNLMNNPTQFNIKILQTYFQSSILRSSNRKLIDHLKFTVKCLFKYKSRNL